MRPSSSDGRGLSAPVPAGLDRAATRGVHETRARADRDSRSSEVASRRALLMKSNRSRGVVVAFGAADQTGRERYLGSPTLL